MTGTFCNSCNVSLDALLKAHLIFLLYSPSIMGHKSLIQRRPSLSHPRWLQYFLFRHTIQYSKLPYTCRYDFCQFSINPWYMRVCSYAILCDIKICRDLRTFWKTLGRKKVLFWVKNQCFLGKKCTITWCIY